MTIDLPLCSEDVKAILEVIFEKEHLKNPQVTLQSGSNIGEGFVGVDAAVEVKDGERTLNLFLKTAPKNAKYRKYLNVKSMFQNEIYFYETVKPAFDKFYKERTGKTLDIAPKCYATNDEESKEIIAMENIKIAHFSLTDTTKFFDKEEVEVVMKLYGKYHGISLAMKHQDKDLFERISSGLGENEVTSIIEKMDIYPFAKRCFKKFGEYLSSSEDAVYLEKLNYLSENLVEIMKKGDSFKSKYGVLCHGDCNSNNYMFRKQDGEMEARLVDFQVLKVSSPLSDLAYFFYSCAASEENLSNFNSFLDIYFESLYHTVRDLGSNPDDVCPRKAIEDEWKIFSPFGFLMCFLILKRIVNPQADVNLVKKIDEREKNGPPVRSLENVEEYAKLLIPILKQMVDGNIL